MYKLNEANAIILQITNDAFFFVKEDEELLDEANMDEVNEILEMFPNGFEIKDDWLYVENTDLIQACFIPYEKVEDDDVDMFQELSKSVTLQLKLTKNNTHVQAWNYRVSSGKRDYVGEYELCLNSTGLICFATGDFRRGKGCLFFLKYFREVRACKDKIPVHLLIDGV